MGKITRTNSDTPQNLSHSASHARYNKDRWWCFAIGTGIALLPIHNQWLTEHTTLPNGEALFFLPTIGYTILFVSLMMFTVRYWERLRRTGLGDRKVLIPLLVIAVAVSISGFATMSPVAPMGSMLLFLLLYLVARVLGKEIFFPLAVGTAVASVGVILFQSLHPGTVTGGYVFEGNYDIVAGYVLLGTALFIHRWRPWLAGLALVAMLLTGSPEALFSLMAIGVTVVIRRDFTKRVLVGASIVLLVIPAVVYSTGLYSYIEDALHDRPSAAVVTAIPEDERRPFSYRLETIKTALSDIRPLGTGYSITEFREGIVHNVPLVIVQQIGWPGILAGLAWLWLVVYCLVKTKWKYAWVLFLSLSVFDHFTWTQLAPWIWVVAGVSTMSGESDRILGKTTILTNKTVISQQEAQKRWERMKKIMTDKS